MNAEFILDALPEDAQHLEELLAQVAARDAELAAARADGELANVVARFAQRLHRVVVRGVSIAAPSSRSSRAWSRPRVTRRRSGSRNTSTPRR